MKKLFFLLACIISTANHYALADSEVSVSEIFSKNSDIVDLSPSEMKETKGAGWSQVINSQTGMALSQAEGLLAIAISSSNTIGVNTAISMPINISVSTPVTVNTPRPRR